MHGHWFKSNNDQSISLNYKSVYVVDSELFCPASGEDENYSEVSADIQNSRAEFAAPCR